MNKPALLASLIVTVVTVAAATQMIDRPQSTTLDFIKQEQEQKQKPEANKPVERITRITQEQSDAMRLEIQRRVLEQANEHLRNLPTKKP